MKKMKYFLGIFIFGLVVTSTSPACAESPTIITNPPTHITASSATFNAYYDAVHGGGMIAVAEASIHFRYGTNPANLSMGTDPVVWNFIASHTISKDVSGLDPYTTYYVQAFAQVNGAMYPGGIMSFQTGQTGNFSGISQTTSSNNNGYVNNPPYVGQPASIGNESFTFFDNVPNIFSTPHSSGSATTTHVYTSSSASSSNSSHSSTGPGSIRLSISDDQESIRRGETAIYTITYSNRGSKTVHDAKLTVALPSSMKYEDSSRGQFRKSSGTIVVSLGDLSPGESKSMTVDARVSKNVDTVRVRATLSYTTSGGSDESVSVTDIDEVSGSGSLSGSIFGADLSLSFFDWILITVLIALVMILVRKNALAKEKKPA